MFRTSSPPTATLPESGFKIRPIMFKSVDLPLPEFGGPMHGANEAAPIDKLLEAVKIYIIALLRLEEIDF